MQFGVLQRVGAVGNYVAGCLMCNIKVAPNTCVLEEHGAFLIVRMRLTPRELVLRASVVNRQIFYCSALSRTALMLPRATREPLSGCALVLLFVCLVNCSLAVSQSLPSQTLRQNSTALSEGAGQYPL